MTSFIYKEEVVRWVKIEIADCDAAMDACDLEYHYRTKALEQVQKDGWDGEDVLECHYAKDHTAEGMGL